MIVNLMGHATFDILFQNKRYHTSKTLLYFQFY